MRIAVGGFQHETNTFAPTKASYDLFERAGSWPGLTRGAAFLEALAGMNIPMAGFATEARHQGHELVPLLWCNASPSAHVTEDAFERITGMLVEDLKKAGPVDAVYLDLHGAMVAEHLQDGEGETIRRVREVVGPSVTIVGSLDLHSNTTPLMIEQSDALVAYRTYPHIDMAETGQRAAILLDRIARQGKPAKAYRQLPFLIPINWQCTMIEPAATIYRQIRELESGDVLSASFTPGFPPADIHDCGPAVFAYAKQQAEADRVVAEIADEIIDREAQFEGRRWSPDEAVREAMRLSAGASKPIVIADTQDNPGGGGNGDTTGMLEALVRNGAQGAVLGLLCDPEVAEAAHAAGEGAVIEMPLGAKSGIPGHAPFQGTFLVEKLGSGSFTATGPFYGGSRMQLGPMALLRVRNGDGDTRVVLCSRKVQAADQEMFRHVGIEPSQQKILVLKSSVHFRADFQPIAEEILVALAPGPVVALAEDLPYRNLRHGIRLGPQGRVYRGAI